MWRLGIEGLGLKTSVDNADIFEKPDIEMQYF